MLHVHCTVALIMISFDIHDAIVNHACIYLQLVVFQIWNDQVDIHINNNAITALINSNNHIKHHTPHDIKLFKSCDQVLWTESP